ncbi:type II toxin-antitoxin system RelE/ParE family toxin [uncultured Enterovirga sp.]|uniref:type II toxin-antitoxin system RelE/ParE family toxin n=1 Tax=uncultured Enterovirga sp. TaxID=2026352 RepID=UPI0035CA1CE3
MRRDVRFDPAAEAEIVRLHDYILDRTGSHLVAEGYTDRIVDRCMRLADIPEQGTSHAHLRPGLRSIGFDRRVTIAFVVEDTSVTILGIFYGGRDTGGLLGR